MKTRIYATPAVKGLRWLVGWPPSYRLLACHTSQWHTCWGGGGGAVREGGVCLLEEGGVHQLGQVMRVAHETLTQCCCNVGPTS